MDFDCLDVITLTTLARRIGHVATMTASWTAMSAADELCASGISTSGGPWWSAASPVNGVTSSSCKRA